MGGGGKQLPSEETNVDNTNIALVNLSENGLTYFGVGEILTVLLLILVIAIIEPTVARNDNRQECWKWSNP